MDNNQSGRLTPKQQELVKRLERIRQNQNMTRQARSEESAPSPQKRASEIRRRNEEAKQTKRKSQQIDNKFARPKAEKIEQKKVTESISAARRRRQAMVTKPKKKASKKKQNSRFVKELKQGDSLARAIVLSEILDKPVALRRR